jgi:hypothetical protein
MDVRSTYLNLSDGGHFENMGGFISADELGSKGQ